MEIRLGDSDEGNRFPLVFGPPFPQETKVGFVSRPTSAHLSSRPLCLSSVCQETGPRLVTPGGERRGKVPIQWYGSTVWMSVFWWLDDPEVCPRRSVGRDSGRRINEL